MEHLSALERERQARILANQKRLQEIGLLQAVQTIATAQTAAAAERRAKARAVKAARRTVDGAGPARRVRRSERVAGIDAPNYCENARLLSLADGGGGEGGRDRCLMRDNITEEIYGVEHLDALGSYQQDWELFVDGYNSNGERIYDKVNGQTCHQCRQKTLGKRTSCSGCGSLQGVLCGDCLFMRYGENVDEVASDPNWLCPLCRDICNCSFHRSKRGWAPTGTLYRRAIAEGYKSVAHYLVLNNLSDEARPVALERGMCPPELAAELKKEIAESAAAGKPKEGAGQAAGAGKQEQAGKAAEEEQEQAPAAAVQDQLLQPEAAPDVEAAPAAAATARRSARGGSSRARGASAGAQQQQAAAAGPAAAHEQQQEGARPAVQPAAPVTVAAAAVPRKRKQTSMIQLAAAEAGAKKLKGEQKALGSSAAAEAEAPQRRGLRSSARLRA